MGLLDFAGNAIGAVLGYQGQKEANSTNKHIAREQMEFQERMSSTAYQRAMGDMKLAGLNPMLAFQQGGASSPPGATTRVENELGAGVSGAVQAAQAMSLIQSARQSAEQQDLIRAEAAKVRSETYDYTLNSAVREWQLEQLRAQTRLGHSQATKTTLEGDDLTHRINALLELNGYEAQAQTLSENARRSGAEADVSEARRQLYQLEIPRAKNEAAWESQMEKVNPALRTLLMLLRSVSNARDMLR